MYGQPLAASTLEALFPLAKAPRLATWLLAPQAGKPVPGLNYPFKNLLQHIHHAPKKNEEGGSNVLDLGFKAAQDLRAPPSWAKRQTTQKTKQPTHELPAHGLSFLAGSLECLAELCDAEPSLFGTFATDYKALYTKFGLAKHVQAWSLLACFCVSSCVMCACTVTCSLFAPVSARC